MIKQLIGIGLSIILSYTIKFDWEALKNTEKEYKNIEFSTEKSELIQELSNVLCEIIKIPELAMRGIIYKAISDWQIKNNKVIRDIEKMPIGKRLNSFKEIFNIGRRILKNMVNDPIPQCDIMIDIAFERAFKIYLRFINQNL